MRRAAIASATDERRACPGAIGGGIGRCCGAFATRRRGLALLGCGAHGVDGRIESIDRGAHGVVGIGTLRTGLGAPQAHLAGEPLDHALHRLQIGLALSLCCSRRGRRPCVLLAAPLTGLGRLRAFGPERPVVVHGLRAARRHWATAEGSATDRAVQPLAAAPVPQKASTRRRGRRRGPQRRLQRRRRGGAHGRRRRPPSWAPHRWLRLRARNGGCEAGPLRRA